MIISRHPGTIITGIEKDLGTYKNGSIELKKSDYTPADVRYYHGLASEVISGSDFNDDIDAAWLDFNGNLSKEIVSTLRVLPYKLNPERSHVPICITLFIGREAKGTYRKIGIRARDVRNPIEKRCKAFESLLSNSEWRFSVTDVKVFGKPNGAPIIVACGVSTKEGRIAMTDNIGIMTHVEALREYELTRHQSVMKSLDELAANVNDKSSATFKEVTPGTTHRAARRAAATRKARSTRSSGEEIDADGFVNAIWICKRLVRGGTRKGDLTTGALRLRIQKGNFPQFAHKGTRNGVALWDKEKVVRFMLENDLMKAEYAREYQSQPS